MIENEYSPYHIWGDSWPHWDELYEAINYIQEYVYKYSKCHLSCKEKYGTMRYEWIFAPGGSGFGFHIILPFFKKYIAGEAFPIYLFHWPQSYIYRLWIRWGKFILKRAIASACKKFPNVREELLDDYDEEYL